MARPPEAAGAGSPEAGAGSPEAAGARSREAARAIAPAPQGPSQARARRARSRCRAAGGASCAILRRTIGAVVLAQRQGEAERAAPAMTGRLRPHAAAVRRHDSVAEVE